MYDVSGWTPSGSGLAQVALTTLWDTIASVQGEAIVPARSWPEAVYELGRAQDRHGRAIREMHVWSHGVPGIPLLGGLMGPPLPQLAAALPQLAVAWWRGGAVHAGEEGRMFAACATEHLSAVSVGHCAPTQYCRGRAMATCALRRGEVPTWTLDRGVHRSGDGYALPATGLIRRRAPLTTPGVLVDIRD